ncbi:lipase 3-like [Musca vetustissima]|uniref:lipase 3-like n=1 Tax=Musca vetustissima TaxID=27455 RepID=UPI002AB6F5CE|nr:lipase 3-like [Musca vetustissima]
MKTCLLFVLVIAVAAAAVPLPSELLKYFIDSEPKLSLKPKLNTADRIAAHGYVVESHDIVTEDGYIITAFRMPNSHKLQNQNAYRPIVLLLHGLFCSSDFWILNGPNDALSFNLVDAGYEVWLLNSRGNTYGRKHISRSPEHPYFWRFSWHEIGYYDVAAQIDYALATNGQGQRAVHFVAHSQGTSAFFVLTSTRPEYNAKIKLAHTMAPIAYVSNMSDKMLTRMAPVLGHRNIVTALFSDQEFLPHNDLFTKLGYNACQPNSKLHGLCSAVAYMFEGSESNANRTALTIMAETHPAGLSTNQMLHTMQEQQSGCFCHYDYGKTKNLKEYGRETPPDYPVEQITANIHLWYCDTDPAVAVEDVELLAAKLPNKVMHHITDPTWSHSDYITHIDVKRLINEPIIVIMNKFEEKL